tara:strand:- start:3481 stop:4092 length:612 start_codon:yes stop_codon:yes gene_type:complete
LKKNKTSKNWIIKQHRDLYFKKSKILGYRSRSSFKLIEIDKKFRFLNKNTYLLDLGSSPGGWSQVAVEKITGGKILAVDIKDMDKINNVSFLKEDFLDNKTHDKIKNYFDKKIDVVISDMATNTSGNKNLDSYNTGQLCLNAMKISLEILNKSGVFVSKLFMGSIFSEINSKANLYFKKVIKIKPSSSRQESKEIYLYCKGIR